MPNPATQTTNSGFEVSDASVTGIAIVGGLLAVIIAASFFIVKGWLLILERHPQSVISRNIIDKRSSTIPAPKLQVDPRSDLERYLTGENQLLGSYGWIDKEHRIVHVPIERAMEEFIRESARSGRQK